MDSCVCICSVSIWLNWKRLSFFKCGLSGVGYKRKLYNIWKVKNKQLPFLCWGVRVSSGTVATHACCHQSTGSHCWYVVVVPSASFRSLFSVALTTGLDEIIPFSPADHSDHWSWKLRHGETNGFQFTFVSLCFSSWIPVCPRSSLPPIHLPS